MPIEKLPIYTTFDQQRFTQFGSMDCANWYAVKVPNSKNEQALYPAMGRKHITYFGENKLIYESQPKQIFRTINYVYVVVGTRVVQVDRFYNERQIGNIPLGANPWFAFLIVGRIVYAILTAESAMYLITEDGNTVTFELITDPNAPQNPEFVAAFGNRFIVGDKNTNDYYLSAFNLGGTPPNVNNCFTVDGAPLLNRASGIVRQMGVLHNQLYIFTDFTTDILANIPTQIEVAGGGVLEFPFKVNTSYNFDYGIADPFSLSIDFGRMVWLAQNSNGLVTFMASDGQQPQPISSQAVNVLLENSREIDELSPYLRFNVDGFLYQYENTIFYRASAGPYENEGILDQTESANSIEFNFSTKTWHRVIEENGERNRIEKHVYFNNQHLVTVQNDPALYQMAGNLYFNEVRNLENEPQADNAFTKLPMRYSLVTPQIYQPDYSEFVTDYIQIDFVFGDRTFYKNLAAFDNAVFIIDEEAGTDGEPIFLVTEESTPGNEEFIIIEEGNTPQFDDNHYYTLFKPHINLFYSDDGGITFDSADVREFSPIGNYRWRMRWYELGPSRNRCYKLVCVSSAPIVILGGVQSVRRASGGAN